MIKTIVTRPLLTKFSIVYKNNYGSYLKRPPMTSYLVDVQGRNGARHETQG